MAFVTTHLPDSNLSNTVQPWDNAGLKHCTKALYLALGREFVTRRTLGMTTSRSMGTVVIYLFCWYHQSTSVNVLRLLVVLFAYSAFFRSFGFVYRLHAWLVSELREVKRDVE